MRRGVAAGLIKQRLRSTDLVLCGLGSTGRAWREQQAPNPTYYASDPMGMGPAMALGLALAQPERGVVLLEGDGDLSMNLGALMAIAGAAPDNLRIAVFYNQRYETGGGQPLAAAGRLSFATVALGAGFPWAADIAAGQPAEPLLDELFARPGPGLVVFPIEPEESPYPPAGELAQVEERTLFMHALHGTP
jgi:thiamine pyrophosphate-dependent acetolactate synthase large subunit-like protein